MEPIVNDYFRFKSLDELEQVESDFNKLIDSDDEDDVNANDIDAGEFFK